MSNFQSLKGRYAVSESSQQAQIRNESFQFAVEVEVELARALQRAGAVYQQFADLEAFVTAHASDYSAAERADMVAVRTKVRQAIADFANAVPGVSGAIIA